MPGNATSLASVPAQCRRSDSLCSLRPSSNTPAGKLAASGHKGKKRHRLGQRQKQLCKALQGDPDQQLKASRVAESIVKPLTAVLLVYCWHSSCRTARASAAPHPVAELALFRRKQVQQAQPQVEEAPPAPKGSQSVVLLGVVLAAAGAVALIWSSWTSRSTRAKPEEGSQQAEDRAQLAQPLTAASQPGTTIEAFPTIAEPQVLESPPVELPATPQSPLSEPAAAPQQQLQEIIAKPKAEAVAEPDAGAPDAARPPPPQQQLQPEAIQAEGRLQDAAARRYAEEQQRRGSELAGATVQVDLEESAEQLQAAASADRREDEPDQDLIDEAMQIVFDAAPVTTDATISPGATTSEAEEQALVPALQDVSAEVSISSPEVALDPGREQIRPPGPQLDIERQRNQPVLLRMAAGGVTLGHPGKKDARGEDAFFIASCGLGAVGVADGVGSWSEDGIDSGNFSRLLMSKAAGLVERRQDRGQELEARSILHNAHLATRNQPGSTTACIGILQPEGTLQVANLGDSGFRIFRDAQCVFESETMLHAFNMPAQLAAVNCKEDYDTSEDAVVYEVDLEEGDLIVFGTDGLFDNMWNDEMEAHIASHLKKSDGEAHRGDLRQLARRLAVAAQSNAAKKGFRSPFAVERARAGIGPLHQRLFPRGGKLDDATVVAAVLTTAPLQP